MAKKTLGRSQEPQNLNPSPQPAVGAMSGNGGTNGVSQNREVTLSDEEIAARAYEIYEREGRSDGRAMDHWLQAESELRTERQRSGVEARQERQDRQDRQELPRSARRHQEAAGV